MINGVNNWISPQYIQPPLEKDRKPSKELDKDAFLQLLITQLKNQDPLEPMDNAKFITQMSELTTLEQITNMSKAFQKLTELQMNLSKLQAAALVGKNVVVSGKYINLKDGAADTIVFNLDDVSPVEIEIYDENDNLVRRISLGTLEAGMHSYVWDGRNEEGVMMPNGTYTYKLFGIDEKGEKVELGGLDGGKVEAVQFQDGNVYIVVNGMQYPISAIIEVSA